MPHADENVIRDLCHAFASGEMAVVDRPLADDVTWHAPGTAQHAGVRRGRAEVYASMGRLAELTGGTRAAPGFAHGLASSGTGTVEAGRSCRRHGRERAAGLVRQRTLRSHSLGSRSLGGEQLGVGHGLAA
jgi:ketosteroid isomerase-like protein